MTVLSLPPLYTAVVAGPEADAAARAAALARDGAEPATFVWAARDDRLDCAVVLRPDEGETADEARAVLPVALLALDDAVGRLAPPGLATDLVWPATLRVNRGTAGGLRLIEGPAAAGAAPDWLVVGAAVQIAQAPDIEGGERPDETSLAAEGCREATSRALAEAFARTLLHWADRWQHEGFAVIARHWRYRATSQSPDMALVYRGEPVAGTVEGLDESGNLVLETAAGRRTLRLAEALRAE